MIPVRPASPPPARRRAAHRGAPTAWLWPLALLALILGGCVGPDRLPQPSTHLPRSVSLPAQVLSNFFIIEARQADGHAYRFLVDTGSSTTIVSPAAAKALGQKPRTAPARTVQGAHGTTTELEPVVLRRLLLGEARFNSVPALIYDFSDLSNHLGLTIDGVLGFPVFRDVLLTLDYAGARLLLAPNPPGELVTVRTAPFASTLTYTAERGTPVIPVQLGVESFNVLIDSGSDAALSLNAAGLHPRFAAGPRPGPPVASIAGDRPQLVGRLGQNFYLGTHTVERPVAELTDQLSSIGGELLRHFTVSFDQERRRVTFTRADDSDVRMPARRTTGLSFRKSDTYWRLLAVVPDSPAAALGVQSGDLCVRINGELTTKWDFARYTTLIQRADKVTYTFLNGAKELDIEASVFDLVP